MTRMEQVSEAEYDIGLLQCLLHYHERVTAPVGQDACQALADGKCPGTLALNQYSEALREAIRCIKIVHGIGVKRPARSERLDKLLQTAGKGCGEGGELQKVLRQKAKHKSDQRHYYRDLILRSVATFVIGLVLMALLETFGLGCLFLALVLCGCFTLLLFTL